MRFVDTLIVANEARFVNRHKLDCVVFFVLFLEVSVGIESFGYKHIKNSLFNYCYWGVVVLETALR